MTCKYCSKPAAHSRGKYPGLCSSHYLRMYRYDRIQRVNTNNSTCQHCTEKAKTKRMCNMHYLRMRRYGRINRAEKKWTKLSGKTHQEYVRLYRKLSGIKSIGAMHKSRFGGLREQVIQRDKEQCVQCGMTREEHKNRWGRDITVDHIDMRGRYSDSPNNTLENLQTMCLSCHGRKDAKLVFEEGVI